MAGPQVAAEWFGVIGVALAAVTATAGYLYRSQVEHRKSARRVLYFLLEIRYSLIASLFDPQELTRSYIQHAIARIRAKGIAIEAERFQEEAGGMISALFEKTIAALTRDSQVRLLEQYEQALFELAATRPVLAYQLLGKEKIEKIAVHARQYQDLTSTLVVGKLSDGRAQNIVKDVSAQATDDAIGKLTRAFDADLLRLARECGRRDLRQCRRALQRPAVNLATEELREVEVYIDAALARLQEAPKA